MFSDVHKHVTAKLSASRIIQDPYPHIIIDEIFPSTFYKLLLQNEIPSSELTNLKTAGRVGKGYSDARSVLNLYESMPDLKTNRVFWENFAKWLDYYFKDMLLRKFKQPLNNVKGDALYTKDTQSYSLGPHTDKVTKVVTCLIYLPADGSNSECGTSIYTPKDSTFTCEGGPHYKREDFNLFQTIPYVPNKMFCFLKTNKSFHGVEPITKSIERPLLIFDLQKDI